MIRSFNDRGEIESIDHDIFNPYKILRSDLSGRYYISDIRPFKKVMKLNFADFPDDTFGVLDVSIVSHTLDVFTEQKRLSDLMEYMQSILVDGGIDLVNENVNFFKDNLIYVINEKSINLYKMKNYKNYIYGRKKTKNELYNMNLIEGSNSLTTYNNEPPTADYGWTHIKRDKPIDEVLQGVSILYTFYSSNGSIYNAQVKIDDIPVEVLYNHSTYTPENKIKERVAKAIMGASVFAITEDGNIYDYFIPNGQDGGDEPGQGMDEMEGGIVYPPRPSEGKKIEKADDTDEYKNRKVYLQIYFKSHTTSNNIFEENIFSIENMKKEMITRNEVNIPDSKYNFRRNRVLGRAAYYESVPESSNKLYIDATKLQYKQEFSRVPADESTFVYNGWWHLLFDPSGISGYLGLHIHEFIDHRGFPSEWDFLTSMRRHQYFYYVTNWRNKVFFSFAYEPDRPWESRLKPVSGNSYGFYADDWVPNGNDTFNTCKRAAFFRIQIKGEVEYPEPIFYNLPAQGQRMTQYGTIANINYRNDGFRPDCPPHLCPIRNTHFVIPYRENYKYINVHYPCVNWLSFPFHRRGFSADKVTNPSIEKETFLNYKEVRAFLCTPTPKWNVNDLNTYLWLSSRGAILDGPRLMFGYAGDRENTTDPYGYLRSHPGLMNSLKPL